jgi:hypothetical protein
MWQGHCKDKTPRLPGMQEVASGNTIGSRMGPGPVLIVNTKANREVEFPTNPPLPAGTLPRSPQSGNAPAGNGAGFTTWAWSNDMMPGAQTRVNGGIKSANFPTVQRLGAQSRVQILVPQAIWNTKIQG